MIAPLQLDGEEEVGAEEAGFDLGVREEGGFAGEFVVGELEEQVGGFPVGEEGFLLIEGASGLLWRMSSRKASGWEPGRAMVLSLR